MNSLLKNIIAWLPNFRARQAGEDEFDYCMRMHEAWGRIGILAAGVQFIAAVGLIIVLALR